MLFYMCEWKSTGGKQDSVNFLTFLVLYYFIILKLKKMRIFKNMLK